jgi:hypothetical protein
VIREFDASGETAASFAGKRGIRKDALLWWRWRLGRPARGAAKRALKAMPSPRVRLVAVDPMSDGSQVSDGARAHPETPAWEILAPSGYVIRVYQRDGIEILRVVLAAMSRGRRR